MAKGRVESALRNPSYLRVANILGLKALDSNNDVNAIESYIRKNGDPYQNALDAANQAAQDIRNQSINDLKSLSSQFAQTVGAYDKNMIYMQQMAAQRADQARQERQAAADRYERSLQRQRQNFNRLLQNQQAEFAAQRETLNGLLLESRESNEALQGTIDETNRISANQANAFVPDANPSAVTATAGDDREQLFSTTRKKSSNQLEDLSLLTGVGTQGNPLAGLQLP